MGETEVRTARDLGGGAGESVWCPGMPRRSQPGTVEDRDLWNVKRRETPEQGRLGKGALVANSKGPRGVSWAVSSLGTAEGP